MRKIELNGECRGKLKFTSNIEPFDETKKGNVTCFATSCKNICC